MRLRRKDDQGDDAALEVRRFSLEAFEVAKAFVRGDAAHEAKAKAAELHERLPAVAARAQAASQDQPDLNRVLSDARLDLTYVMAGGARPSSVRLAHFQDDQARQ